MLQGVEIKRLVCSRPKLNLLSLGSPDTILDTIIQELLTPDPDSLTPDPDTLIPKTQTQIPDPEILVTET